MYQNSFFLSFPTKKVNNNKFSSKNIVHVSAWLNKNCLSARVRLFILSWNSEKFEFTKYALFGLADCTISMWEAVSYSEIVFLHWRSYSKRELIVFFSIDLVYFSAFIRVFFDQYFFQAYIFSLCKVARFKLDPFNAYSADSLSANETFLPIRNGILLPKLFWLTVRKKMF